MRRLAPPPAPRTASGVTPAWSPRSDATRFPPPSTGPLHRHRPSTGRAARRPVGALPRRRPPALTLRRTPAASAGVSTPLALTTTAGCHPRIPPSPSRHSIATAPAAALPVQASACADGVASLVPAAVSACVAAGALVTAIGAAPPAADDETLPGATPLPDVTTPDRSTAFALSTPTPTGTATAPTRNRPGHAPSATTATATRPATTAIPSLPPPRPPGPFRCLRPGCAPHSRPRPAPAAPAPWSSATSRARPDLGSRRP